MFNPLKPARSRATILAAVVLVFGLLLSGCGLLSGADAARDSSGTITSSATADAFSIKAGDCVIEPEGTTFTDIVAVPCGQPHDLEAYAVTNMDDGDYPGQQAIDDKSDEFCAAEFEKFIGISFDESTLVYYPFTPTTSSWQGGDREIVCVVGADKAKTVGSLQDSKK